MRKLLVSEWKAGRRRHLPHGFDKVGAPEARMARKAVEIGIVLREVFEPAHIAGNGNVELALLLGQFEQGISIARASALLLSWQRVRIRICGKGNSLMINVHDFSNNQAPNSRAARGAQQQRNRAASRARRYVSSIETIAPALRLRRLIRRQHRHSDDVRDCRA